MRAIPKINDLTNRPGGPQPTDEFWLASAGAAADFKSTIDALTGAVLGNISVITNPSVNGYTFRIPEVRLQIAWRNSADNALRTTTNEVAGSDSYFTDTETINFPHPFVGNLPAVVPACQAAQGYADGYIVSKSLTGVVMRGQGVNNVQTIRFGYIAIGRY